MRLRGKVAIVTGAGGGIGAATAQAMAREGAAVVCVDRNGASVQRVAERIAAEGGTAIAVMADVASADENEATVARAVDAFGGLDVYHANAAVQEIGGLEATAAATWARLHEVNVYGVASGIRCAVPALRSRGGGSVIITSSVLGIVGDADLPAYGATKGALRALCRSLAAAHGAEGIRVNAICPGDVETPLVEEFFAFQPDPEAARRRVTEHYPLGRLGSPADVAHAAVFLASDEAAFITGIDLVVDGGLLARIY